MTTRRSFLQVLSTALTVFCAGAKSVAIGAVTPNADRPGSWNMSSVCFDAVGAKVDMEDEQFRLHYFWPAVHKLKEMAQKNGAKKFLALPDNSGADWTCFVKVQDMPIRFSAAYLEREDSVILRADCSYLT